MPGRRGLSDRARAPEPGGRGSGPGPVRGSLADPSRGRAGGGPSATPPSPSPSRRLRSAETCWGRSGAAAASAPSLGLVRDVRTLRPRPGGLAAASPHWRRGGRPLSTASRTFAPGAFPTRGRPARGASARPAPQLLGRLSSSAPQLVGRLSFSGAPARRRPSFREPQLVGRRASRLLRGGRRLPRPLRPLSKDSTGPLTFGAARRPLRAA